MVSKVFTILALAGAAFATAVDTTCTDSITTHVSTTSCTEQPAHSTQVVVSTPAVYTPVVASTPAVSTHVVVVSTPVASVPAQSAPVPTTSCSQESAHSTHVVVSTPAVPVPQVSSSPCPTLATVVVSSSAAALAPKPSVYGTGAAAPSGVASPSGSVPYHSATPSPIKPANAAGRNAAAGILMVAGFAAALMI